TVHFTGDLLERVDHHFAVGVLDVRDGLTALRRARVGGADVDGALRHGVPPEVWSGADRSAVDHAVGVVAFSWCTEVVGSEDPPDHDRDDRGAGELLGEPGDVPVQRGGDDDRLDLVVRGVALDLPPQGRAGDRLRLHLDGDTAGEDVHAIPLAEA